MIAAISERKSIEQTSVREEIQPEIQEYRVAKPAEILVLDYRQTRTE